ncbi:MAG: ssDNA-binding domain-containing protein [Holophagales bacterium]|nr:ssDNA-binding domain-containing protein [Holophagales bacterium]
MSNEVYQIITDQILKLLEQGTVPWHRPWSQVSGDGPLNVRGTPYRGANYFILGALGYKRPIYLTFRQALELGGYVKRRERGWPVVYWKMLEAKNPADTDKETEDEPKKIPFLRYFTVFNIAQCEGLSLPDRFDEKPQPLPCFDPIKAAEKIWTGYQNPPSLRFSGGRASYAPSPDRITMPPKEAFESGEEYYSTLFHEMGHSTGHKARLSRQFGFSRGHQDYAREELVAEMCSAFLCAKAGISQPVIENQAAYLDSWSQALKKDSKLFVTAAGKAQKAADHILGVNASDEGESGGDMCA